MNCDYTSPGGTPLERLAQQQAGTHPAPCARPVPAEKGIVTVTTNDAGRCVMVSRQDEDHRILSVIWEAKDVPTEPVNARLLTALKVCRHKFAQYVAHHISKGDMHKAMANESMVAMADVAIMGAEAAPRVARLTHPDIAKALASAGLKPEDYREDGEILPLVVAIEAAVLRKNGIEVSE